MDLRQKLKILINFITVLSIVWSFNSLYGDDKKLKIILAPDFKFHIYDYPVVPSTYTYGNNDAGVNTAILSYFSIPPTTEVDQIARAILFASRLGREHYGSISNVLSYDEYLDAIEDGALSLGFSDVGVCIDIHHFVSMLLNRDGVNAAVIGNLFVNQLGKHAITLGRTSDEKYFLIDYGRHYQGSKNLFELINYYHIVKNSWPAGRIAIRDAQHNTNFFYIPKKSQIIRSILGIYDPYKELQEVLLNKDYFGPNLNKGNAFDKIFNNTLTLAPGSGNLGTWIKAQYSMFFINGGFLYPSFPYNNQNMGFVTAGADFKGHFDEFFKWSVRLYGLFAGLTKETESNTMLGFGLDLLLLGNFNITKKIIITPLIGSGLTQGYSILNAAGTVQNEGDPFEYCLSENYLFFGLEFTFKDLHFSFGTHNVITTDVPPPSKEQIYFFSESKIYVTVFYDIQTMKLLVIPEFAIRPEAFRAAVTVKLEKIANGLLDLTMKSDVHITRSVYYPYMMIIELAGTFNFTKSIGATLSLFSNSEFWGTKSITYSHSMDIKAGAIIKF